MMRVVVAVTGASGVVLGRRLVEVLKSEKYLKNFEVHVIVSEAAEKIALLEEVDLAGLKDIADHFHRGDDLTASIASSSFPVDVMVVLPCSMKTLSAIANGFCDNLVTRCAENILKTGRLLILAPRDAPFSAAALENMVKLSRLGVVVLPPVMAYYYKPESLDDVNDFFVGKVLDCMNVEHSLYSRWRGL